MSAVITDVEPLFTSAHAAIKFAVTFEGRPERPAMNRSYVSRVSDGIRPPSKGLNGNDGAAQAGIISAKMRELGETKEKILIAKTAFRSMKCECRRPCCSGVQLNPVWVAAINFLADDIGPLLKRKTKGRYLNHEYRSALMMRLFGEKKLHIQDIADAHNFDRDTVSADYARLHKWIMGQKPTGIDPASDGLEQQAWTQIEKSLRSLGIVE